MFNPANFNLNQHLEDSARDAERGCDPVGAQGNKAHAMIAELRAAAQRFALRRDDFARGKASTCNDIADKLDRFGSFASERQADFADKLVEWSKPRQEFTLGDIPKGVTQARTSELAATVRANPVLPKLFDLMQRLAKLEIGAITIARKNQDSLCWIKHADAEKVIGRLTDGGTLTLWQRPGIDMAEATRALLAIEADPEGEAARHGRASGRCSVCSRDLTDPESIERGIGPICAAKFSF